MPDLRPFFDAPLAAAQAAVDGSLSDAAGRLSAESDRRAAAEQRAAGLQSQLDDLRANPPVPAAPSDGIPWVPGTKLQSDKTYFLPQNSPAGIVVDVPMVKLVGGSVIPTASGPAINVRPGGMDCQIIDVHFGVPGVPPKAAKLGVKPCVQTTAIGTKVLGCTADAVDDFVIGLTGCTELVVSYCTGTENLRAGFVYVAGAKHVIVTYCDASESQTENLVRASPDGTNVTENFLIAFNQFANDANGDPEKAVIDVRHVRKARIIGNALRSIPQHSCVGIGSHDGVGPGAEDVLVYDNDCYGGSITVNGGANNVNVDGNRAHWAARGENSFVGANFKIPQLQALRVANNSGVSPVAQKGMVGFMGDPTGRKFENVNNLWEIKQ